jgi:hypothetical protein
VVFKLSVIKNGKFDKDDADMSSLYFFLSHIYKCMYMYTYCTVHAVLTHGKSDVEKGLQLSYMY